MWLYNNRCVHMCCCRKEPVLYTIPVFAVKYFKKRFACIESCEHLKRWQAIINLSDSQGGNSLTRSAALTRWTPGNTFQLLLLMLIMISATITSARSNRISNIFPTTQIFVIFQLKQLNSGLERSTLYSLICINSK